MKAIERAAVARILIDLIKADKFIDAREMDLYRSLKSQYSITRDDEIYAYSLTLGEAVAIVSEMKSEEITELSDIFHEMTVSDGFCAREEALLMIMLEFCLTESDLECDVFSVPIEDTWFDDRQVLYIESHHARDINHAINSNLRTLTNELKLCGLDFVYLPAVLQNYILTPRELLNDVVGMLAPDLTTHAAGELITKIKLFKTDTFCIEQLHHKLGFTELADTPPALMLRVSQSKVNGRIVTNFLRICLTQDVTGIVRRLTDTFIAYNGNDRIVVSHQRESRGSFLYKGFYRQLFEILLLQKAVMCHMLIDFVHSTISFPEINVTLNRLHRKEKALYTLFVYALSEIGEINFTTPSNARQLEKFNLRMEHLQQTYSRIYEAFGGEASSAPDIRKPEIRLPMIANIKKSILQQAEKIYEADRFIIRRDPKTGFYGLTANPEVFISLDFSSTTPQSIFSSNLFTTL